MAPADWSRVKELFDAALDLEPDQRSPFLAAALPDGDDQSLAIISEVEELLAADAKTQDTDAVIGELVVAELGGIEIVRAGQKIGGYEIQRVLGTGGMSTVFLAVQEHPHREVALKTMLLGMLSDQASRRFETESEILGRLRHPAIAQVYEAGTWREPLAGKEVPFFAMEYVEAAQPLDDYVRDKGLDLRATVKLLLLICEAVHYGHQLGVIHRDLKPANVLVDASGRPKVIDFGIARATDADMSGLTMQTQTGHVLGTLQYMPPEQLDGLPGEIDIRSDVYALGVIFYELLAGSPPFDPSGRSLSSFTRLVRDTDSKLPSQHRGGFELTGLSLELDWIARKAIAADKAERYQSVSEFAADLRRFLANQPVSVGPPSTAYHLRKFVRRNKGLVASAVIVFLVLVTGVATTTWYGLEADARRREAELQESRAVTAKNTAVRQAVKAETINRFYIELLKFADPAEGRYRSRPDWTIRQALDASSKSWFEQLAQDPDVEAHLRFSMGNAYRSLEELDKAEAHLRRAVELRRSTLAPDDPDLADAILSLAVTMSARDQRQAAIELYREALPIFVAAYGEEHGKVALCNLNIGTANRYLGNQEVAEQYIRRALDLYRRLPGDQDRFIASCLPHLGSVVYHRGRPAEAIKLYRQSLVMYERAGRGWHPHAGAAHSVLAQLLELVDNDLAGAVTHMRKSLEIHQKAYGPTAKATGRAHLIFGKLLFRATRYPEAETELGAAARIFAVTYPKGAVQTLDVRCRWATTLRALQRDRAAFEVADHGFRAARLVHGRASKVLLAMVLELARCMRGRGELADAEALLRAQLALDARGTKKTARLLTQVELAIVLVERAELEAAAELFAAILPAAEELLAKDPKLKAACRRAHGLLLREQRNFAAAEREFRAALAGFEDSYPAGHMHLRRTLRDLVGLYRVWGRPVEQGRYQARLDR